MRRIEESSARRQARVERGEDVIVGCEQVSTGRSRCRGCPPDRQLPKCGMRRYAAWAKSGPGATRPGSMRRSPSCRHAPSPAATCWPPPSRPPHGAPRSGRSPAPWNPRGDGTRPGWRWCPGSTRTPMETTSVSARCATRYASSPTSRGGGPRIRGQGRTGRPRQGRQGHRQCLQRPGLFGGTESAVPVRPPKRRTGPPNSTSMWWASPPWPARTGRWCRS